MPTTEDLLDSVLNLEQEYHDQGYKDGHDTGISSGFWDAYILGVEQSYEKFIQLGLLRGRAAVWDHRQSLVPAKGAEPAGPADDRGQEPVFLSSRRLPIGSAAGPLPHTPPALSLSALQSKDRARRHILGLKNLLKQEHISTENTDDAVDKVDYTIRQATAKARLIERVLDEDFDSFYKTLQKTEEPPEPAAGPGGAGQSNLRVKAPRPGDNIEDFGL